MTPKELGELGHLERASPIVDPADFPPIEEDLALEDRGLAKSVGHLRDYAAALETTKAKRIHFDFFAKPLRIEGKEAVEAVIVERTKLVDGRAVGTGDEYRVPASLVVTCIGYASPMIPGVPYDHKGGKFLNDHGQISDSLYCVGWARRGPTGTIGTNRPDGYEVADQISAAMPPGSGGAKSGGIGLDRLLGDRDVQATSYADWRTIEAAEVAAARAGAPREKFVRHGDWLKALEG
jgi:ferredoxin--NADP+ reductase